MDTQDFKTKLIKLRNSIQDYLDQLDLDEVDKKPEKGEKKPEKKPDPEDEDGKKKEG